MLKIALHYARYSRYALSALATVAFKLTAN
jgi:hypothetical protein